MPETGAKYRQLIEDETAAVEAEADEVASEADIATAEAASEAYNRKTLYHLQRFLELSGREVPAEGIVCPTCEMGLVSAALSPDPAYTRCSRCDGWGRVGTGSRVAGNAEQICPHCQGRGFGGDLPQVTEAPQTETYAIPIVPYTPPPVVAGAV